MATKIRLRRMGRSKRPVFSIVVIDSRRSRDSSFIEDLGRYYPLREPAEVVLKEDRALHWLRTGAQASDTVRGIFSERGLMLRLHLERKGKSEEEIEELVSEWEENRKSDAGKFDVISREERDARTEVAEPETDVAEQEEAEEDQAAEAAEEDQEEEGEVTPEEDDEEEKAEDEDEMEDDDIEASGGEETDDADEDTDDEAEEQDDDEEDEDEGDADEDTDDEAEEQDDKEEDEDEGEEDEDEKDEEGAEDDDEDDEDEEEEEDEDEDDEDEEDRG